MIDYTTVAGGDRFGNIFVNRLDMKVSEQIDDDPTGAGILHEKGLLMGAPHKTKMIAFPCWRPCHLYQQNVSRCWWSRSIIIYRPPRYDWYPSAIRI